MLENNGSIRPEAALVFAHLIINNEPQVENTFMSYMQDNDFEGLMERLGDINSRWKRSSYTGKLFQVIEIAEKAGALDSLSAYRLQFLTLEGEPSILASYSMYTDDCDFAELQDTFDRILKKRDPTTMPASHGVLLAVDLMVPKNNYTPLPALTQEISGWFPLDPGIDGLHDSGDAPNQSFVQTLCALREVGAINKKDHALLLHLSRNNYPVLLAAWSLYEVDRGSPQAWLELGDSIQRILRAHQPTNFLYSKYVHLLYKNRALSRSERDYLWFLLQEQDPSLIRVFENFEATSDTNVFLDFILDIAGQWRKNSTHQELLQLIENLVQENRITLQHADLLECKIFSADALLLAAFDELRDASFTDEGWNEFFDTLSRILHRQPRQQKQQHVDNAVECIRLLASVHEISTAQRGHLEQLVDSKNAQLLHIFEEYEDTQDVYLLFNALIQLSDSWRYENANQDLLGTVDLLLENETITLQVHQVLERCVFDCDPFLLAAYDVYTMGQSDPKQAWMEFWDSLALIVSENSENRLKLETYSSYREACINALRVDGVLNTTDLAYLRHLLSTGDVCIDAIFHLFEEEGDLDDLQHSLKRLSRRWKREHHYSDLLDLIDQLPGAGILRRSECEVLDALVYMEDPVLLASFDQYESGLFDPIEDPGSTGEQPSLELWDTIVRILHREVKDVGDTYAADARALIYSLHDARRIPTSDAHYLIHLVEEQDEVLLAAFAVLAGKLEDNKLSPSGQVAEDQKAEKELVDTVVRLGSRWRPRTQYPQRGMLALLQYFLDEDILPARDVNILDTLVYNFDSDLVKAYENWLTAEGGFSTNGWEFLWRTILEVLRREEQNMLEHLSALAAGWLQTYPFDEAGGSEIAPVGRLYLEQLVAQNDPVLLSAFAQYDNSGDGQDLLDTLARIASRWQDVSPHQGLLGLLDRMSLPPEILQKLKLLVFYEDPELLDTYSVVSEGLASSSTTTRELAEFRDILLHMHKRHSYSPELQVEDHSVQLDVLNQFIDYLGKEKIITVVEHAHLRSLANSSDPELQECIGSFQRTGNVTAFEDHITQLGSRWRQVSEYGGLLRFLRSLWNTHMITNDEFQYLELLVYLENYVLLSASDVATDCLSSVDLDGGDLLPAIEAEAGKEMWDTIQHVLEKHYQNVCSQSATECVRWITFLWRHYNVPSSDLLYLFDLANAEEPDPVVYAAISLLCEADEEQNGDPETTRIRSRELLDTLMRLGSRWREELDSLGSYALYLLTYLTNNGYLNNSDRDILDVLLYRCDPFLYQVVEYYHSNQNDYNSWVQVWNCVQALLEREESNRVMKYTTQAYHYIQRRVQKGEISSAGASYLLTLLTEDVEDADSTLMASFAEYEDTKNANELYDTIVRLSNRWRQQCSAVELDLAYLIDDLFSMGTLDRDMYDLLEYLVFTRDPTLMSAHACYIESTFPAPVSEDSSECAPRNEIWTELWDTIARIIKKHLGISMSTHTTHLTGIVDDMLRKEMVSCGEAEYLQNLVLDVNGDILMQKSFYQYLGTGDIVQLQETLAHLGKRWRCKSPHVDLLAYIHELKVRAYLTFFEQNILERCVLEEDDSIVSAWDLQEITGQEEMLDTLYVILDREISRSYEIRKRTCMSLGKYLKNSGAISPADYMHLIHLAEPYNETSFACLPLALSHHIDQEALYRNVQLMNDIIKFSSSWRGHLSGSSERLLSIIQYLEEHKGLTKRESNVLEVMVYEEDEMIMAAYELYAETDGWLDFYDTLTRILSFHRFQNARKYASLAKRIVPFFLEHPAITYTGKLHVGFLIDSGDDVVVDAVKDFEQDLNEDDLQHLLIAHSSSWQSSLDPLRAGLLQLLFLLINPSDESEADTQSESIPLARLPKELLEPLEHLVYTSDPVLLDAYSGYADTGFDKEVWIDFWETLVKICRQYTDTPLVNKFTILERCIDILTDRGCLSTTDKLYLMDLSRHEDGGLMLEQCIRDYLLSQDFRKFGDALYQLSSVWRQSDNNGAILEVFSWLAHKGFITSTEWDTLEGLLYDQDNALVAASAIWLEAREGSVQHLPEFHIGLDPTTQEFYQTICAILDRELCTISIGYINEAYRHLKDLLTHHQVGKADACSLRDLIRQGKDPALLAIIEQAGESSTVLDDPELLDSLRRLGQRWRRQGMNTEILDYISQNLDYITVADLDVLELLVYRNDPDLLHAVDLALQQSVDGDFGTTHNLLDVVSRLLEQEQKYEIRNGLCAAEMYISELRNTSNISFAGIEYLSSLLVEQDPVLIAAFVPVLEGETIDSSDLYDTLGRLAARWKRLPSLPQLDSDLLFLIDLLSDNGSIDQDTAEVLEFLVYKKDVTLLNAYRLYREQLAARAPTEFTNGYDHDWAEFWDTLARLVYRESNIKLVTEGSHLRSCVQSLFARNVLSEAEYLHLLEIVDKENSVVLDAAFTNYLDDGDLRELNHTLIHLATQWRRGSPYAILLFYVLDLNAEGIITFVEREFLERLILVRDPTICSAYVRWEDSRQTDPFGADALILDTILALLDDHVAKTMRALRQHAFEQIHSLKSAHHDAFPEADYLYLLDLAHQSIPDESETLFACVADFLQSQQSSCKEAELHDSLMRLGSRWRRRTNHFFRALLSVLDYLSSCHAFLESEIELLDLMVYQEHETLLEAFGEFYTSLNMNQRSSAWYRLLDVMMYLIENNEKGAEETDEGENIQNEISKQISTVIEEYGMTYTERDFLFHLLAQNEPTLAAIVCLYREDNNYGDFADSLQRLALRWRENIPSMSMDILELIYSLMSSGCINEVAGQYLELLVYRGDPVLLAAYSIYAEDGFSRLGWQECWETFCEVAEPYVGPINGIASINGQELAEQLARFIDDLYAEQKNHYLSGTGYRYLKHLAQEGDPTLDAAFIRYAETGDVPELTNTLLQLSSQWRQSNSNGDLLEYLDGLLQYSHITVAEWDLLQNCVYLEQPVLISAFAVAKEEIQDGLRSNKDVFDDLFDTVCRVLDNSFGRFCNQFTAASKKYIRNLKSRNRDLLPDSVCAYLEDLADLQDPVFFACIAEVAHNQDGVEIPDTLIRLGTRWRRQSPYTDLLEFILRLHGANVITLEEANTLDLLVYHQYAVLCGAWDIYDETDQNLLQELVETMFMVLDTEQKLRFDEYQGIAEHFIENLPDKRKIDAISMHHITGLAHTRNEMLMEVVAEYTDTQDTEKLLDSLSRIATGWKLEPVVDEITTLITYLEDQRFVSEDMADTLLALAYQRDEILFHHFRMYLAEGDW